MPKAVKLTLYDPETHEVKKTFTQTFVPWKMIKRALKLQKLNVDALTDDDYEEITALVIDVFGNRITKEELENGAELGEMMTVFTGILAMVNGGPQDGPFPKV